MYYEIYVDSLFLFHLVMNYLLLVLVNQSTLRTATRRRMALAAAGGTIIYLLPFFFPHKASFGMGGTILVGTVLMMWLAFRISTLRMFCRVLETMIWYSFLMGGAIYVWNRVAGLAGSGRTPMSGYLTGTVFLAGLVLLRSRKNRQGADSCKVLMRAAESEVHITGLVDSGNGLVEPISGKPVSVVEQEVFDSLYREPPELFRAIPFHSIGKEHGIMKGYLVPEVWLEYRGIRRQYRDVYIAVSKEAITGSGTNREAANIKIIVNPMLLEQ